MKVLELPYGTLSRLVEVVALRLGVMATSYSLMVPVKDMEPPVVVLLLVILMVWAEVAVVPVAIGLSLLSVQV